MLLWTFLRLFASVASPSCLLVLVARLVQYRSIEANKSSVLLWVNLVLGSRFRPYQAMSSASPWLSSLDAWSWRTECVCVWGGGGGITSRNRCEINFSCPLSASSHTQVTISQVQRVWADRQECLSWLMQQSPFVVRFSSSRLFAEVFSWVRCGPFGGHTMHGNQSISKSCMTINSGSTCQRALKLRQMKSGILTLGRTFDFSFWLDVMGSK